MPNEPHVIEIQGRKIIIRGIGRLFYESGFPISMSLQEAKSRGMEISILHAADECLNNGWSPKTVVNKFKADFEDDMNSGAINLEHLEKFCNSSYDEQRGMIFEYLFGPGKEGINNAVTFFKNITDESVRTSK